MDSVYSITVKLGWDAAAFGSGAALAMRVFGDLEKAATSADSSVDRLGVRAAKLDQQLANATVGTQRYFDLFGASTVAMADHTAAVNAAVEAHEKLNAAMTSMGLIAGGGIAIGAGLGVLGWLKNATDQANDLNTVMIGIGTRLTDNRGFGLTGPEQLAAEKALVTKGTDVGLSSGMSTIDMANIIQAAEGAGITSESKLMTMMQPLANLGEILRLNKGIDPTQSATIATQFAHLFGAYGDRTLTDAQGHKVSDLSYMTDLLTRALFVTPGSPSEFLTLTSYLAGPLRTLYGSKGNGPQEAISQSIETAALLARLGQESRGGMQFAQIVSRIAGAGRGSAAGLQELKDASGVGSFFNAQGQLTDIPKLVTALAAVGASRNPQQAEKIYFDAFGQIGNRLAGLLADPQTVAQLDLIATQLGPKGLPTRKAMQQAYNESPAGQLIQAQKAEQDLEIALGQGLLPVMAAVAKAEVGIVTPLAEFFNQHKTIAGFTADVAGAAAILVTLGGTVAVVKGSLGILGLTGALSKAIDFLKDLDVAEGLAAAGMDAFAVAQDAAAASTGALVAALDTLVPLLAVVSLAKITGDLSHQNATTLADQTPGSHVEDFLWMSDVVKNGQHASAWDWLGQFLMLKQTPQDILLQKKYGGHWGGFVGGGGPGPALITGGIGGGVPLSAPALRGNGGPGGAPSVVHHHNVTIVVNGADHKTTHELAKRVADEVRKTNADSLHKHLLRQSIHVTTLRPVPRGIG